MGRLLRFLNVGGALTAGIGGVLALVALVKGREARSLRGVISVDNLTELKHLLNLVPVIIAVTGRVWAPKPVKCNLSDGEGAIVELREDKKSERRTSSIWLSDSEPLRQMVRETEWALTDGSGPFTVQLPIVDGRRAAGDYLQMSGDVFLPAQEGLVEQVIGQLAGHKVLGTRRSERFLPVGTALTAVGELRAVVDHPNAFKSAVRSKGKMYVLQEPQHGPFLLSRQRLPDMIASAQATSRLCGELAAWCVAVGASMMLTSAGYSLWVRHRENKARERVQTALAQQRARRQAEEAAARTRQPGRPGGAAGAGEGPGAVGGHEGQQEEQRRSLCVACLDRECSMVFTACGHLCLCQQCSSGGAEVMRCPICRSSGRPIRVYLT